MHFHFCFEGQDISLLHISIVKMSLHSRRGSKHTAAYITPLSSLCDLISFGLSQERQKVPSVSSSHHINLNSIILHHIYNDLKIKVCSALKLKIIHPIILYYTAWFLLNLNSTIDNLFDRCTSGVHCLYLLPWLFQMVFLLM